MADLLVDTDIFVDHLRGAHELKPKEHRLFYSVFSRAELFAGTAASDAVTRLLSAFRELPVDRGVAERAGRMRRESGLRLPDALVAATALVHGPRARHPEPTRLRTRPRAAYPGVALTPPGTRPRTALRPTARS